MDQELNTIEGTARADFLRGSWQGDLILAGAGSDLIFARAGHDIVDAGDGNDRVFAGSGDDLVKTGQGRDFADGGSGVDTAQFDGDRSDYRITSFFGLTFVTDLRNGETDTLTRFEFLKFDDGLFDINGDPVASDPEAVDDEASTIEDVAITINVLANDSDPNDDPLTVSKATATSGTVDINTDGTLQYTPPENFSGEDTITYTVEDGNGGTSSAVVTVLVGGVADRPQLFAPQSAETKDVADIELTQLVATLVDKDGSEKLTIRFSNLPEGAVILNPAAIAAKDGQITELGSLIEALGADIGQLKEDVDEISKQIEELEQGNPDSEDLPPLQEQRANLQKQLVEKTDARSKAQADLDQAKFDKAQLTREADANGEIEFHDLGSGFVLRLAEGTTEDFFLGVQAFATESDPVLDEADRVAENRATIKIIVGEAPEGNDDEAETKEDTPVTINVLANDADSDGDKLMVTEVTDGKLGTVVMNGDGTVDYRPNRDVSGEDMFTYTVEDGNGGTSKATVKVLVGGVADRPQLVAPENYEISDQAELQLEGLLARLVDRDDSEKLTVTFSLLPEGAVILNPPAIAEKDALITELDSLIEALGADIAQISENIAELSGRIADLERNNPDSEDLEPLRQQRTDLQKQEAEKTAGNAKARQDREQAKFDREQLTKEADANGEIEFHDLENGFVLRLPEGTTEDFILRVKAVATESDPVLDEDDREATNGVVINLSLLESPDAQDDTATTEEDTPVTIAVLGNDSDSDGDPLTVIDVIGPSNGFTVINADNSITYTPNPNFSGDDQFTYSITDGNGGTSSATVKVAVGGVADKPTLALPKTLSTIDLAPIVLDDINAELVDQDGSESLRIVLRGLPFGSTVFKQAEVAEKTQAIDELTGQIADLDRLLAEAETELVEILAAIEAEEQRPEPSQVELAELNARKEAVENLLRASTDSREKAIADRDVLNAEVKDLTKETDANGAIELHEFGDGYVLQLPAGTTDGFQFKVDAIATESDPVASEQQRTAFTSGQIGVSVFETLAPNDDEANTAEDTPVTIFATTNDVGEWLLITDPGDPTHGTVVIDDNGDLVYTPDLDFSGVDSFDYTVTDSFGLQETATVRVTVGGVADEPSLSVPTDLVVTDLAPISLNGIDASLTDRDGSESLKVKLGGLPAGSVISHPARIGGLTGLIEAFQSDIDRNDAQRTQLESDLAEIIAAIDDLENVSDPTQEQLDELAALEQAQQGFESDLQNLADQRAVSEAERDKRIADRDKLTQEAGPDGHVEIENFQELSPGFVLQLPDGVIDDFKLTVEAIATEADPFSDETRTASTTVEVDVSVEEGPTAVDDELSVREDEAGQVDVLANDAASVTFDDLGNGTHGTTRDLGNGVVEYTPNANYSGSDEFTYSVINPDGTVSIATVRVIVNGVADIPGLTVPESLQTIDLADISLDDIRGSLADDDGSENLLIRLSDVPDGAVVTNPGAIADREAESVALDASIKLLGIEIGTKQRQVDQKRLELVDLRDNNAPQVEIDAKQQEIDDLNRQISDHNKDIAQANERISELDLEIEAFTIAPPPGFGGTVGYDGLIGGWVLRLAPGTTDDFVFGVEALAFESEPVLNSDDRQAVSERTTVDVRVLESATNEDPIAVDDFVEADSGVTVNINVLGNDFDLDGDDLAIDLVSRVPINGQATVRVDRTIDYESAPGFVGTDSFEYTISDGNGGEATATVTVQVDPVNNAPEGAPVVTGTPEVDQTLTADVGGITDADGLGQFTYQWELFTGADINSDLSWTPIAGASQQSFTPDSDLVDQQVRVRVFYTDVGGTFETLVSAPSGEIESAPDTNLDPIAIDNIATTEPNKPVEIDVLENDRDPDGDPLFIQSISPLNNGQAEVTPDGTILYSPNLGFIGGEIFTYDVSDGNGGTASATVRVTVAETVGGGGGGGGPIFVPPIDDGGGRPPEDGGGKTPPDGGLNPIIPILPNPIQGNFAASQDPAGGTMTGTPDSDVFLFSQGDGAVSLLGFKQATGTAGEVADQIQFSGFDLAFADLDSNDDGRVDADDAGEARVSGGDGAPLALDFGGDDVLLVNGVSFLTEDDLLFV